MNNHIPNIDRANRVLTMLSRVNRSIVRAESPDELYRQVCQIAVECGLFRYAWIGMVDAYRGCIRMMASHGAACTSEELLAAPDGLADQACKQNRMFIYSDLSALPEETGGAEMARNGIHALAVLPLREAGKPAGALLLCADQSEYFDETVVELLEEVADDIAYSLGHMLDEQRRLAVESKLYYTAFYDAQTGLPNRALLEERLPQLARRSSAFALMDIRLQRLDKVAEIFGRLAMDEVLRILAQRLEESRGVECLLAQLALDEFVLVSLEAQDGEAAATVAVQLLRTLEQPVRIEDKEIFLHPSIGAVLYPRHEPDVTRLLRRARVAAEQSNANGGFRLYSMEMDEGVEQRVAMEAELHRALERNEFELFYQPQINLQSGGLTGVEALLRWRHPQRGLVGPDLFIPLLEECGLMPTVGRWVTRTACSQAKAWQAQGAGALRVAVNVSALQFRGGDFVPMVAEVLRDTELDAQYLELELTESLILENVEQTISAMHELNALGVCLALDDFGTGYSSLSYLRRYPIDRLKIDRSFVHDMTEHASSAALVRSILAMAGNLGLRTIAEGVETASQLNWLRTQSCEEMQGYLFSRPVPADEISRMLAEGRDLTAAVSGLDGGQSRGA